jgi:hypothetical protein
MSYSKNTIYSTVIQCNYIQDYFNHITTNINTLNEKKFPNFNIQTIQYDGSILIQISLELIISYNNTQKFNIPICILIPKTFPFEPPIFYVILKEPNTIYNQQNQDIDIKSGKLLVKSILKWDYSLGLLDLINEISISFNNIFPILQAPPGYNRINQAENFNTNINKISQENFMKSTMGNCKLITLNLFLSLII